MLRKWMILCTALIVLSLVIVPAGDAQAYAGGWRGIAWSAEAGTGPYEPDDSAAQAKVITNGATQTRSIVPRTDLDWIRFQLTTASAVVLETSGPLPSDTHMTLYSGNLTQLEFSDDQGTGFYSYIDRVCGDDPLPAGTYYVKVEEFHQRAQIQSYNLFFNAGPCPGEIVDVYVGAETQGENADRHGSSLLPPHGSVRRSFAGLNAGPLQIVNRSNLPLIAAERVIYKVNGVNTSFSEMMALPHAQLDTVYWLPWYNNVDLDTQLRFANTTTSPATVQVYIGGVPMMGSPFALPAGTSLRKSFPGVNNGPVQIVSNVNIVAAERVIYKVNGIPVSYSEMMALPNGQVDTTYWLPWYNNVDLDTQLRVANVSGSPATVHISIGGVPMTGSPFSVPAGVSTRMSFAGINNGPVQIVSNQPIVAAERVIYKVNNVNTSFSEMMALPNSQLNAIHWLPFYNNVDLDSQLRFAVP